MKLNNVVVSNTSAKDWKGRNGTVVLYSFQVEGNNEWFRCGTERPPFTRGDCISFDYTAANGSNTVDLKTVTLAEKVVTKAPAAPGRPAKTQENWDARAAYWDAKEKREIEVVEPRITLSAARTAAIAVIGLALQHDAIAFGNASKSNKLGIILDAIDEVTGRYYKQSMTAGQTAETVQPEVSEPQARDGDLEE